MCVTLTREDACRGMWEHVGSHVIPVFCDGGCGVGVFFSSSLARSFRPYWHSTEEGTR